MKIIQGCKCKSEIQLYVFLMIKELTTTNEALVYLALILQFLSF